jgi:L-ascorbate metabolism protein UlaG (beta-lactamase superfamily)
MTTAKLRWLGHASIQVELDGQVIFFDPWIKGNPTCPIQLADITRAAAVCVTHGHDDHLGNSIEIAKATGAPLVCTPEIGFYAARHGVPYDEGSMPLNVGGSWHTDGFTITMTNAVHTSEILGYEYARDKTVMPGAGSVGYVLEFKDGPSIYYGGDTGVFGDMAIIRELYSPDVAVLPVGGKYNMGIREAGYAASLLHPRVFVPIHFDTFPNQRQDLDRLEQEIHFRAPRTTLVRWKPGDTWECSE